MRFFLAPLCLIAVTSTAHAIGGIYKFRIIADAPTVNFQSDDWRLAREAAVRWEFARAQFGLPGDERVSYAAQVFLTRARTLAQGKGSPQQTAFEDQLIFLFDLVFRKHPHANTDLLWRLIYAALDEAQRLGLERSYIESLPDQLLRSRQVKLKENCSWRFW